MVLFRSLDKSCSELLKKDFVHEGAWQVAIKHAEQNPVLTQNASVSPSGTLVASSSMRHAAPWGFVEGVYGTSSFSTNFSYKFKFLPGLIFGGRFEQKHDAPKGVKGKGDVSLEYSREDTVLGKKKAMSFLTPHLKLSMDPLMSKWTLQTTAGVSLNHDSVLRVGAEATGPSDMKSMSYSVGASFFQVAHEKSWVLSVMGYPMDGVPLGKIVGGIHCRSTIGGSAEVGAEVSHYLSKGHSPEITFGGLWYLNQTREGEKTDTILKMRLSQDANVALALSHKLSHAVHATLGAQVNALKPETVKCGMALRITA